MQASHLAAGWIVEKDGADADLCGELEGVGDREEWLVLADGLVLVVEDRPSGGDPSRRYDWAAISDGPRIGEGFPLDIAGESVAVGEGMLISGPAVYEIGDVCFAGQRIYAGRAWLRIASGAVVGSEVVQDAGGGTAENRPGICQRVGEVLLDRRLVQVGGTAGERVAEVLGRLAHHGGSGHQSEHVEGDCGAVSVRVGDLSGLENAVVGYSGGDVADRVGGGRGQEVVRVVGDVRDGAEGIDGSAWQEETGLSQRQFLRRRVGGAWRVIDLPGWNPPSLLAGELHVSAFGEGSIGDEGPERHLDEAGGQGQPV